MTKPARTSPEDARKKVREGDMLLVCAYDDQGKFEQNELEGAISLDEFKERLPKMSKSTPFAFY